MWEVACGRHPSTFTAIWWGIIAILKRSRDLTRKSNHVTKSVCCRSLVGDGVLIDINVFFLLLLLLLLLFLLLLFSSSSSSFLFTCTLSGLNITDFNYNDSSTAEIMFQIMTDIRFDGVTVCVVISFQFIFSDTSPLVFKNLICFRKVTRTISIGRLFQHLDACLFRRLGNPKTFTHIFYWEFKKK